MNYEEWVTEFFRLVDSRQPEKIAEYMTEDVRLRLKGQKIADYRIFIEPTLAFID